MHRSVCSKLAWRLHTRAHAKCAHARTHTFARTCTTHLRLVLLVSDALFSCFGSLHRGARRPNSTRHERLAVFCGRSFNPADHNQRADTGSNSEGARGKGEVLYRTQHVPHRAADVHQSPARRPRLLSVALMCVLCVWPSRCCRWLCVTPPGGSRRPRFGWPKPRRQHRSKKKQPSKWQSPSLLAWQLIDRVWVPFVGASERKHWLRQKLRKHRRHRRKLRKNKRPRLPLMLPQLRRHRLPLMQSLQQQMKLQVLPRLQLRTRSMKMAASSDMACEGKHSKLHFCELKGRRFSLPPLPIEKESAHACVSSFWYTHDTGHTISTR